MAIIDIFISILIYFKFFASKWKDLSKKQFIINTIFYIYIVAVIYLTLMPIISSIPRIRISNYTPMHLIPFEDYFKNRGNASFQLIANIAMFIPFGFLLPQVKDYKFIKVLLIAFLATLSIELLQPLIVSYRISDITDVITNTSGAIIGYIIYYIFYKLIKRT